MGVLAQWQRIKASPINQRRWSQFKANRRGHWSFWIFIVLFFISLFAEFVANDKPIVIRYQQQWMMPIFQQYSELDFGGDLDIDGNVSIGETTDSNTSVTINCFFSALAIIIYATSQEAIFIKSPISCQRNRSRIAVNCSENNSPIINSLRNQQSYRMCQTHSKNKRPITDQQVDANRA